MYFFLLFYYRKTFFVGLVWSCAIAPLIYISASLLFILSLCIYMSFFFVLFTIILRYFQNVYFYLSLIFFLRKTKDRNPCIKRTCTERPITRTFQKSQHTNFYKRKIHLKKRWAYLVNLASLIFGERPTVYASMSTQQYVAMKPSMI